MKVGGSQPCFTTMMGVSMSRPLGSLRRYSCAITAAASFSEALAPFPIQKKTCGGGTVSSTGVGRGPRGPLAGDTQGWAPGTHPWSEGAG